MIRFDNILFVLAARFVPVWAFIVFYLIFVGTGSWLFWLSYITGLALLTIVPIFLFPFPKRSVGYTATATSVSIIAPGYSFTSPSPEPDAEPADDIQGWRWMIHNSGSLLSGLHDPNWRTGERVAPLAVCTGLYNGGQAGTHQAPDWNCEPGCGYHALFKLESLDSLNSSLTAHVRVSAIGKTILGERGFRTSSFRIEEIAVHDQCPPEVSERLSAQFLVPVVLSPRCQPVVPAGHQRIMLHGGHYIDIPESTMGQRLSIDEPELEVTDEHGKTIARCHCGTCSGNGEDSSARLPETSDSSAPSA